MLVSLESVFSHRLASHSISALNSHVFQVGLRYMSSLRINIRQSNSILLSHVRVQIRQGTHRRAKSLTLSFCLISSFLSNKTIISAEFSFESSQMHCLNISCCFDESTEFNSDLLLSANLFLLRSTRRASKLSEEVTNKNISHSSLFLLTTNVFVVTSRGNNLVCSWFSKIQNVYVHFILIVK